MLLWLEVPPQTLRSAWQIRARSRPEGCCRADGAGACHAQGWQTSAALPFEEGLLGGTGRGRPHLDGEAVHEPLQGEIQV